VIKARDYAVIRKVLRDDPKRKDSFTEEDIDAYVRALSAPGALTGAINYYRATFRQAPWTTSQNFQIIHNPVQVLWGVHDRYLGEELASPPPSWVPNAQVELCAEASHWLMTDQPEWVNAHLTKFLSDT
jgi:pimeloyl-ACP methyl ester carboxylesterase